MTRPVYKTIRLAFNYQGSVEGSIFSINSLLPHFAKRSRHLYEPSHPRL